MRIKVESTAVLLLLALVAAHLPIALPVEYARAAEGTNGSMPQAKSVLSAAFSNLYEVDMIAGIELIMRNTFGQERRRRFHMVSKIVGDRMHSIGRLVWPHHLRGMTVMMIEAAERRGYDAFLFLPSLGKVRRVSMAQRGDAFLGSDLTYEDFERRRIEDFELKRIDERDANGEGVYAIRATPTRKLNYAEIEFVVARSDLAILETRQFKRGDENPYRIVVAPRESMQVRDGHVLPTRLIVENLSRHTTTEVEFHDLAINPPIDRHLFSLATLESNRPLPRLND